MPWYKSTERESWTSSTMQYSPHNIYFSISDEAIEKTKELIKDLARDIDSFNQEKKRLEKEKNIDAARYYRELIGDWTRQWRANKLVLGYFIDEKSLPYICISQWPKDLLEELDRAYYSISIRS